jgi:enamine deaminase RidA (YjgF/YER057c/UK114 family)
MSSPVLQRMEEGPRFSQIVVVPPLVFLAGQVAADPSADIAGQTRQVLAQIDALLAKAGSARDRIASVTIYLKDIGQFAAMNAVWDTWVPAGAKPVRATVQASLAAPPYLVEMSVIAAQ